MISLVPGLFEKTISFSALRPKQVEELRVRLYGLYVLLADLVAVDTVEQSTAWGVGV